MGSRREPVAAAAMDAGARGDEWSGTGSWVRVASAADVREGAPSPASARAVDLVLLRTRGGLRAYEGRCPHQGALLGEGEIEDRALVCRNHRWRFDVDTGERIGGKECLRACPVKEEGGEVLVDLGALERVSERGSGSVRSVDDLPGPRPLPLVGNAFQIESTRLHQILEGWAKTYGSPYLVQIGPRKMVVISDPEVGAHLFRERPETYRRPSSLETIFDEMMVAGVFSAEGEAWRAQRRLAMQALSQRHLRGFYPTLHEVALRLLQRWTDAAAARRELDVAEELKRFTVDVTTRLVFGHDANTLAKDDGDVLQRHLEHIFPALGRRLYALFPYWRYFRLPADRRLDRALRQVYAWLTSIIEGARETLAAHPERAEAPANFIEAMLTARDPDGKPFADSVIFGNALTMLLAGEDTTAYSLAWAIHHLSDTPSAAAALRREADAFIGEGRVAADLDQANRLAYATAVANETMRLRPVAPAFLFEPNHDVVLGDVAIPAHTGIAFLSRLPVVDPARFDAPDAFRPERWMDAAARTGPHDAAVHIPFGSGPRICPGRALALLEMRVVLSMLYKNFDVERLGDGKDVRELLAFTLAPVGLRARLTSR